ncbi:MAG: hypothetical protein Q4F84_05000 [Fibrobacter sp.]|nr:hypothetical protein [Fibrobacter sp.]
MKRWWRIAEFVSLTAIISLVACGGVSDKFLEQAETRIDNLKSMGVPDSALSSVKVNLYQAKDSKQRGHTNVTKKAGSALKKELAALEADYKVIVAQKQSSLDSLRSIINQARSELSPIAVKKIDSVMVKVDSLANLKWYLEACNVAKGIADRVPDFKKDMSRADELRGKVPGKWICTNLTKSTENKAINAVEKKIFTFNRDGSVLLIENKKGQSGPYLKEDWEFVSKGTYDIFGDTIYLFISRFASVRQNFHKIYVENGKKVWKNEPQPTYDSAITDGSQDRSITYDVLMDDFVKSK